MISTAGLDGDRVAAESRRERTSEHVVERFSASEAARVRAVKHSRIGSAGSTRSRSSAASAPPSATRCGACCCRRSRAPPSPPCKIDGVLHEFSPIPGVVEDATDIILNIKQVPLKMHTDTTKTHVLCASRRRGEVKARDIQTDADVEILEPDARIATVVRGRQSSTWKCA